MSRVKDWLGKHLFPGSGRHAAGGELTMPPSRPPDLVLDPPPAEVFLDPHAAGQAWRLQHTEAEHAAAAEERVRTAGWTRPLTGEQS